MLFSQKLLRIRKKWHFFILDPRHLFFSQKKQQKNGFSWQHSGAGGRPSAAFLDWIHQCRLASDRAGKRYPCPRGLDAGKRRLIWQALNGDIDRKMDSHGSTVGRRAAFGRIFWIGSTSAVWQAIGPASATRVRVR